MVLQFFLMSTFAFYFYRLLSDLSGRHMQPFPSIFLPPTWDISEIESWNRLFKFSPWEAGNWAPLRNPEPHYIHSAFLFLRYFDDSCFILAMVVHCNAFAPALEQTYEIKIRRITMERCFFRYALKRARLLKSFARPCNQFRRMILVIQSLRRIMLQTYSSSAWTPAYIAMTCPPQNQTCRGARYVNPLTTSISLLPFFFLNEKRLACRNMNRYMISL
jgi:hypothetical protein